MLGSPGRMKYACSECTRRSAGTVRPAATRAWPATWPPNTRTVESAGAAHEPHRIAFYLYDLASEFHALWTKGRDLPNLRFISKDNADLTKARLAMVQGVVSVLASGLGILGVHAPDEMR